MSMRTALLFPGQGSYIPGMLEHLVQEAPRARDVLDTVDAVCTETGREPVSSLLTDAAAPAASKLMVERPGDLDLAMFAGNLACFEILTARGVRADVLAGHSFGELAALTAAGAVSVEDATRMVCLRADAFREVPPPEGGMVALALDLRRATHLVGLLDEPEVAVAVDNGPTQCVVSGPWASLTQAEELASAANASPVRLRAAYPFHSPVLRSVNAVFAARSRDIPMSAPSIPVYSAMLNKYIESAADLRSLSDCHLTSPVRFYDCLLQLHRDGTRAFVESGGQDTLTRLVGKCLPSGPRGIAPFTSRASADELTQSLNALTSGGRTADTIAMSFEQAGTEAPAVAEDTVGLPASRADEEKPPVSNTVAASDTSAAPPDGEDAPPAADEQSADASSGTAPQTPAEPVTTDNVLSELRVIYAEFLDLPEDLLDEEVDLEADLGVDSIKQIEAFDLARKRFGRQQPPEDLRTTSYTTLPKLAELVQDLPTEEKTAS